MVLCPDVILFRFIIRCPHSNLIKYQLIYKQMNRCNYINLIKHLVDYTSRPESLNILYKKWMFSCGLAPSASCWSPSFPSLFPRSTQQMVRVVFLTNPKMQWLEGVKSSCTNPAQTAPTRRADTTCLVSNWHRFCSLLVSCALISFWGLLPWPGTMHNMLCTLYLM